MAEPDRAAGAKRDEHLLRVPADVEFGFRGGRLALLQIRPFNESKRAQRSQFLAEMDAPARARGDEPVWIGGRPGQPDPAAESAKRTLASIG